MENAIPKPVRILLDADLAALEPLRSHQYGVYIYGSVALGAFEERLSDIDIVVLTHAPLAAPEVAALAGVHAELKRANRLGARLQVSYLPLRDLGKGRGEVAPYPFATDGTFHAAGHHDLNSVTWWLIKYASIRLLGPARDTLPLGVPWQDVLAAMRYNLEGYWAGKARRPLLFLSDYWIDFADTTLCRILTTLEDGEIIAKSAALARWRDRLPARWHRLLDETWRIRHVPRARSPYRSRLARLHDTRAFIAYVRERAACTWMESEIESRRHELSTPPARRVRE